MRGSAGTTLVVALLASSVAIGGELRVWGEELAESRHSIPADLAQLTSLAHVTTATRIGLEVVSLSAEDDLCEVLRIFRPLDIRTLWFTDTVFQAGWQAGVAALKSVSDVRLSGRALVEAKATVWNELPLECLALTDGVISEAKFLQLSSLRVLEISNSSVKSVSENKASPSLKAIFLRTSTFEPIFLRSCLSGGGVQNLSIVSCVGPVDHWAIEIGDAKGRLSSLALVGLRLGAEWPRHVQEMATLRSLDLARSEIGDEVIEWVSRQPALKWLSLSGARLRPESISLLRIENLEYLDLGGIEGILAETVIGLSRGTQLRELRLLATRPEVVDAIAELSRSLPNCRIVASR